MYAAMGTRPDILYSTTALSQFLQCPTRPHWVAVKRVLRYLKGTQHAQLVYQAPADGSDCPLAVHGYSDSDWGNDVSDRRSVTGWVFLLYGCAVSWQSRKQRSTALSSVEAEYMATAAATKEAVWWRRFLTELGLPPPGPTLIYSDSQGSIAERGQSTSATARRLAHETTDDHSHTTQQHTATQQRGGGWTVTSVGMIYDNR